MRIVVLNHNGGPHVVECLDALAKTDWPADALELVMVDNASTDGSVEAVEERHPGVRVIRSAENTGFPANNLALRDLDDVDYAGLVNNDAFVTPGWLRPLVDALEADPELGAACPKIVFAPQFADLEITSATFQPPGDGRTLGVRVCGIEVEGEERWRAAQMVDGFWPEERWPGEGPSQWTNGRGVVRVPLPPDARGVVRARVQLAASTATEAHLRTSRTDARVTVDATPTWVDVEVEGPGYDVINNVGSQIVEGGFGGDRGFLERDGGQYDEPADVFAWCGGGVLMRRGYLESAGLFDERFFLYYEDTDLSWRGRALGWRYRYVPTSLIRHIHAASSGEGSALFQHYVERNRLLMLLRNAPARLVVLAVVRYLRAVAGFALAQIVRPMLRGHRPSPGLVLRRMRSLLAAVKLAPAMLRDRRRLRARQVVPDAELLAWMRPA